MTQWGLDTLFNPAKRHMDEEKRRLQATREELGDSSGGKRIDLDSGKVTIKRAGRKADAESGAESDAEFDTEFDTEADSESDTDAEPGISAHTDARAETDTDD
jgi:hypothetical protein